MIELTPGIVRELIDYDPETGQLTWRERDRKWVKSDKEWKRWNGRYSGKPAFTFTNRYGYRYGKILRQCIMAHRVAFAHFHGRWPENDIDHINRDKADNRIANLRDVSRSRNLRNMPRQKNNTSGVCGVTWHKEKKAWFARIGVKKKQIRLGYFERKEDAIAARQKAEREYGFSKNHGC